MTTTGAPTIRASRRGAPILSLSMGCSACKTGRRREKGRDAHLSSPVEDVTMTNVLHPIMLYV
jgi:hypothetical protein